MEYQNAADILPEDYLAEKRQAYNVARKSKFLFALGICDYFWYFCYCFVFVLRLTKLCEIFSFSYNHI